MTDRKRKPPFSMSVLLAIEEAQAQAHLAGDHRIAVELDMRRQEYFDAFSTHRPVNVSEALESLELALDIARSRAPTDHDADALARVLPYVIQDISAGQPPSALISRLKFLTDMTELAGDLVTAGLLKEVLKVLMRLSSGKSVGASVHGLAL